jgi:hypothetical protein
MHDVIKEYGNGGVIIRLLSDATNVTLVVITMERELKGQRNK